MVLLMAYLACALKKMLVYCVKCLIKHSNYFGRRSFYIDLSHRTNIELPGGLLSPIL